jgi:hypothetical protein
MSAVVLPLPWHLAVQSLAAAVALMRVPRACAWACGAAAAGASAVSADGASSLCGAAAALARMEGLGLTLLPGVAGGSCAAAVDGGPGSAGGAWAGAAGGGGTGGTGGLECCLPVMGVAVLVRVLVATTALAMAVEAASRLSFLSSSRAPGHPHVRSAARRQLLAACAVGAAVGVSALPALWDASTAGARWALGLSPPGLLSAGALFTAVAAHSIMRVWLHTVLWLFVARPAAAAFGRAEERALARRRPCRPPSPAAAVAAAAAAAADAAWAGVAQASGSSAAGPSAAREVGR